MRVLIQRVISASVSINNQIKSSIESGLLVFVGIENRDDLSDVQWLSNKIVNLRVFDDHDHVPNQSVKDIDGSILLISQFTLHASTKKGNRPSYILASKPDAALPLYEALIQQLEIDFQKKISTGTFGADMKVNLINDGPITIWMDSKNRE